jgi:hypothetical protein
MVTSSAVAVYTGYRLFGNPLTALFLFSLNYSLIYLIYLARSYSFSKGITPQVSEALPG